MNKYLVIILIALITISLTLLLCTKVNINTRMKKDEILYNRFKVDTVIHRRLIIATDIITNKKYFLSKDFRWFVTSPYLDK